MAKKKLQIWLSATSLLDESFGQIVAILSKHYKIVYSQQLIAYSGANFTLEKHLKKLERCDLFLGIINSKLSKPDIIVQNIYLEEIKKAIALNLPYWYLVHRDVTFSRRLLNDLVLKDGKKLSKNKNFFDIRTIDVYNEIIAQSPEDKNLNQPREFYRLDDLLNAFGETFLREEHTELTKLMIASTVYGFEDQLSKIIEDIKNQNFMVLNSFYGSIKVNPTLSNLENCTNAVEETNWFLGIIRPYYGTGNIKDIGDKHSEEKNITFEEIKTANQLKLPRWFYVHRDVSFGSKILKYIEVNKVDETAHQLPNILKRNNEIDMEAIELYNYVIKDEEANLALRNGNWAQEFFTIAEAEIYIQTQFLDFSFIENLLNKTKNGR